MLSPRRRAQDSAVASEDGEYGDNLAHRVDRLPSLTSSLTATRNAGRKLQQNSTRLPNASFTQSAAAAGCVDVDDCSTNPCDDFGDNDGTCTDMCDSSGCGGIACEHLKYDCTCSPGFLLSHHSCRRINICALHPGPCKNGEVCTSDFVGSNYTFSCTSGTFAPTTVTTTTAPTTAIPTTATPTTAVPTTAAPSSSAPTPQPTTGPSSPTARPSAAPSYAPISAGIFRAETMSTTYRNPSEHF